MLAVGEIFKAENLQVLITAHFILLTSDSHVPTHVLTPYHIIVQYSTDQLIKEVENSIEEFKRYNQDYDEGNIKQQVF